MKRKSIEPCSDVGDPKKKSRFKMASRSHVEENGLEDDPWTGPAKRAEVHQIPEILEIIFGYVEQSFVYELRFVSKIWNLEACTIIRRNSHISVRQELNEPKYDNFAELLATNRSLHLPLPFKLVTVWMDRWNYSILDEIAFDDRIQLYLKFFDTGLDSRHGEIQRSLYKILSTPSMSRKLLSLEFGCFKSSTMHLDLVQLKRRQKYNFPKMSQLTFNGLIGSNDTIDTLIEIINSSPNIQSVIVGGELQRGYLIEIFERADLRHVTELQYDLSFGILPSPHDLPNLKRLCVTLTSYEAEFEDVENFTAHRQIVQAFSEQLKELEITWNSKEANLNSSGFPFCMSLEKLKVHDWGSHIAAFSHQKLPSLKEICLYQDVLNTDNLGISSVHPGVKIFRFNSQVLYPNDMIDNLQFIRFLRHVSIQFPCVNALHLTWNMRPENFYIILQRFPRLETLELNSHYGFHESIFTGTGTAILRFHSYIRRPQLLNMNPATDRKPCIMDLKFLKNLKLEHAWTAHENPDIDVLTNGAMVNGIAGIPALQTLQIQWNPHLSPLALERLGHLKSINVIVDRNTVTKEMCSQLRKLWPLVKVIRVTHGSRRLTWFEWIFTWVKSLVKLG